MNEKIKAAVVALPETYQKIFGHPELSEETSRDCLDRATELEKIVKELQEYYGKKELRILDIGCAQGFYSLSLAKMGCTVKGIDGNPENVHLCQLLGEENNLTSCSFEEKFLTMDYADQISEKYDVVLAMSVMHHVALQNGFDTAKAIFEKLTAVSKIIISEMAVKEEPVFWNVFLPDSYEEWFSHIRFFDEVAFFDTHLSSIRRPLIISSNHLLYLKEKFSPIDFYSNKAYALKAEDGAKRYYRSGELFIKLMRSSNPKGKKELENEIAFKTKNRDISFLNGIIGADINETRTYSVERFISGRLLLDLVNDHEKCQWDYVFEDLLKKLIELEEHGFYHGDLRLWNVICDTQHNQAELIDFGIIRKDPSDDLAREISGTNRFTVYDAFISLIYNTLTYQSYPFIAQYGIYDPGIYYDVEMLEERYRYFIKAYLINRETADFREIHNIFQRYIIQREKAVFSTEEEGRIQEMLIGRLHEVSKTRIEAYAEYKKQEYEIHLLEENYSLFQRSVNDLVILNTQLQNQIRDMSYRVEQNKTQIGELEKENEKLRNEIQTIKNWIVLRVYRRLRRRGS